MADGPGFRPTGRNLESAVDETGVPPGRRFFAAPAAMIAAAGVPLIEAIGATYSWIESGTEHLASIRASGRQPIYALWHGRIMPGIIYLRDRGIVVMTSQNFDGEWIARVIRRFGYSPARGSSSHGGARALVEMRREMRAGRPVAFTVDGPRGPREIAKPGAAWLASSTGNPILPFHVESSSHWTIASWDRHQIPKPGSVVAAVMAPPIHVARHADAEAIAAACQELETSLARLKARALELIEPDRSPGAM